MSDMDRSADPTVEEIIAGIEKMRGAGATVVASAPSPSHDDTPDGSQSTDTLSMGARFRYGARDLPPVKSVEEYARAAMRAAADATLQPWLAKDFPRILEERLDTLLKARMVAFANMLNQLVAEAVNDRLELALKQRVAAVEQGLASSIPQQIADAFNQRFEPALNQRAAAVEERVTSALSQQVASAVDERLEPARRQIVVIEERVTAAVREQVKAQLRQLLERCVAD